MAKYVESRDLRNWIYLDEGVDDEKVELILASAETSVSNDLDCATLKDYEDTNGMIPAPLVEAILIKAGQSYAAPDDLQHSGVTVMNHYSQLIKPYVKFVKSSTTA